MSLEKQNQYLDYLVDTSFQGVNELFVLLFENNDSRKAHRGYFLPETTRLLLWSMEKTILISCLKMI